METLVLIIAALILAAGIVLWRVDSSKRSKVPTEPEEPETPISEPPTPPHEAEWFGEGESETIHEPEPDRVEAVYTDEDADLDVETEVGLAEVPEVVEADVVVAEPEPEVAYQPEVDVEEGQRGVDKASFLHSFPGSQRRERKHWASKHGFDFIREDAFLTDEWSRGAASTGAPARDVVSGMAEGYETHLVDLAGVPVMAMRRGITSDVVIDARRGTQQEDLGREESDDLVEVDTVSGFRLLSNTAGVTQRFVDERVRVALEAMPEAVTAVWMESDWVLAETTKASTSEDWENILQPLALLTDATFTLPPRSNSARHLDLTRIEPTRVKPDAPENSGVRVNHEEADLTQPLVIRPEEPLQMPVRAQQDSRGVVEPRALGADDVDSIADGAPTRPTNFDGTRVVRDLSGGSRIFDDSDDATEPPAEWDRES